MKIDMLHWTITFPTFTSDVFEYSKIHHKDAHCFRLLSLTGDLYSCFFGDVDGRRVRLLNNLCTRLEELQWKKPEDNRLKSSKS